MKKKIPQHKLIYEEVLKQVQKEDVAFFSKCTKFRDQTPHPITLERALQFLWLKNKNINRNTALQFGKRRVCKIDATMKFDGPSTARIIRTKKIESGMINGWHNGAIDPQYDLGEEYNVKKRNSEDEVEYETFVKQEQQSPSDYKIKLEHQSLYNQNMNDKYDISNMEPVLLHKKLIELKAINRAKSEQPQEYVEVEGQKFYHILSDIPEYLDKKEDQSTLISQMRAFQRFYPIKRKLQVKQMNQGDQFQNGLSETQHLFKFSSQGNITQKIDRKRTMTNIKMEQFNNSNYIYNVNDVPNMAQQIRKNHFNQLIEELKENGMNTPKEINDYSPEPSVRASIIESIEPEQKQQNKFFLKFPKSKVDSTQTTAHTKYNRFGTIQSSSQYLIKEQRTQPFHRHSTFRASISNIYASSTELSPTKQKNRFDLRIDKFIQQRIQDQNSLNTNINIDITNLKQQYKVTVSFIESVQNQKEINRQIECLKVNKQIR